jgi:hypothetical protein
VQHEADHRPKKLTGGNFIKIYVLDLTADKIFLIILHQAFVLVLPYHDLQERRFRKMPYFVAELLIVQADMDGIILSINDCRDSIASEESSCSATSEIFRSE